jgi:hypothetical protein
MIDRRAFLHSLIAAGVTAAAAPSVVYILAPPQGWALGDGSLFSANNGFASYSWWLRKTPEEILADVNAYLYPEFKTRHLEKDDWSPLDVNATLVLRDKYLEFKTRRLKEYDWWFPGQSHEKADL